MTRRHFHDADDPATECKGGRRLYYMAYAVIKSATAQSAISVSDALCRLPTDFHARRKLGFRCAPIARATSVGERKTIAEKSAFSCFIRFQRVCDGVTASLPNSESKDDVIGVDSPLYPCRPIARHGNNF